jgi:hypothetical protein
MHPRRCKAPGQMMSASVQIPRAASTRRMVLVGIATFMTVMLAASVVLWAQLGTAVFFELIAAGMRYCF